MNPITNQSTPSEKSRDSLNKLSKEFKPDDVKFLLALKSDFSMEESIDNAEAAIKRLEKYVKNGNSAEKTNLKYKLIDKY